VKVVKKLLTSVTLVLKNHDETHSTSVIPNIHLAKGQVRPSSKYV